MTQTGAVPGPVDSAAVVRANTRFALRLHASMATVQGNRFLSPFSVSAALTLATAGARGETLRQMTAVLGLPEPTGPGSCCFKARTRNRL